MINILFIEIVHYTLKYRNFTFTKFLEFIAKLIFALSEKYLCSQLKYIRNYNINLLKILLFRGLELSFTYKQKKMFHSNEPYACSEKGLKKVKLAILY